VTRGVVFIESNTTGTGELFVRRAHALGFVPTVVAADHARYGFEGIDGIVTVHADTSDRDGLVDVVRELGERPPAAVMSTSDYFVGVAARVAERLDLASPGGEAVDRCRDKAQQREVLAAAGVPIPAFQAARSVDAALAAGTRLGLPVVCKPVVGSGSFGVRLCADAGELGDHVRRLLGAPVNERGGAIKPELLVERFVAGDEYSVEIVAGQVQAVVRKHLGAMPHFVELGHDYPAQLAATELQRLCDAARDAVRALGLTRGPCHVEARMAAGNVWIIEVNPRLAGGRIPVLVQRCGGPDLIEATIRTALGEPVDDPPAPALHGALRFVVTSGPMIAGPVAPALVGDHGSWEAQMYVAPGTAVRQHQDFRDRVGHAMACSSWADEARRSAERRAERLAQALMPTCAPGPPSAPGAPGAVIPAAASPGGAA
jgi:S-sulfo-L-cysteine synthase (3-phospho-L-serine-dependent)